MKKGNGKRRSTTELFNALVKHFSGIPNLAKARGCTQQAIYMWRGKIPNRVAFEMESLTGGKITADEIKAANSKAA